MPRLYLALIKQHQDEVWWQEMPASLVPVTPSSNSRPLDYVRRFPKQIAILVKGITKVETVSLMHMRENILKRQATFCTYLHDKWLFENSSCSRFPISAVTSKPHCKLTVLYEENEKCPKVSKQYLGNDLQKAS